MNWEDILIKRELKDGETTITHDECKDMEKKILAEVKKEGGALGMKNLKGIGSPKKLKMVLEDMKKRGTIHEHSNGDFYTHEPKLSKKSIDLILPRGKQKVLKAEDKDYDRGLLVKLLKNGTGNYMNGDRELRMDSNQNYGDNASMNVIVSLTATDYVQVYVTEGTIYGTDTSYTHFGGYLLS